MKYVKLINHVGWYKGDETIWGIEFKFVSLYDGYETILEEYSFVTKNEVAAYFKADTENWKCTSTGCACEFIETKYREIYNQCGAPYEIIDTWHTDKGETQDVHTKKQDPFELVTDKLLDLEERMS